jgi:hypothetical protein
MNSLERAALLNNEGIVLLQKSNQLGASIRKFQLALGAVQSEAKRNLFPLSRHATPAVTSWTHYACRPLASKQSSTESGHYYVYNRPFKILTDKLVSRTTTHEEYCSSLELVGCHVLFNLAVACHELAKSTGREATIQRAARHYGVLLHLIKGMTINHCRDASLDRLKFLVFNNLAHLHYELCQYNKVTMCLDIMMNMYIDNTSLEGMIPPDDLSRIFWNALHVKPPATALAA